MTVPTQRGSETAGPDWPTVLLESVRRLEDSMSHGFETLQRGMAQLRDETVHRREFDRYRDERAIELTATKTQHDGDVKELKAAIKELKETDEQRAAQATSHRRGLWGLGIGSAVGIAGDVIAAIALHH